MTASVYLALWHYHLEATSEVIKEVAQALKYVGLAATTGLSLFTLRRKTVVKSQNPEEPNRLTSHGKKYAVWLVVVGLTTAAASYLEDFADSKIKEAAQETGNAKLMSSIMGRVAPKFEDQSNRLSGAATSIEHLRGDLTDTVADEVEFTRAEQAIEIQLNKHVQSTCR